MYKLVETDRKVTRTNGVRITPLCTLADEYGGRAQIIVDDHCLVLLLRQEDGTYKPTPYLFQEALDVIKSLVS